MSKFKNNLIDTNIFPSFILSTDLNTLVSADSINKEFNDIRGSDAGVNRTNVGGWRSEPFHEIDGFADYPSLRELGALTVEFVDEFLGENKTNLYTSSLKSWLLENESGDYNTLHNHGRTDLIGVYYLTVPEKCSGLTLLRTDAFTHTTLCGSNESNLFSMSFTPPITAGRLFIISGHLYHYVRSFPGDGLRRSVVFNVNCTNR